MSKKKINSVILGIIVAVNILLVANLLQYFVVNKCMNIVTNANITVSDSPSYDVISQYLVNKAKRVALVSNILYLLRETVIIVEVYYLIKVIGKRFYISIINLQTTLITMFVIELMPCIYNMICGVSIKPSDIIYILVCISICFAFMYKFIVDKKEAEMILEIREKRRIDKSNNKKSSNKIRKKQSINKEEKKSGYKAN